MEKIESIESEVWESGYNTMEGWIIKTNKQTIRIGITNDQCCCESWGHICSNDSVDPFIGAELKSIKLTDTALNSATIGEKLPSHFDEGAVQFVDIETDRGALQLAVYNVHNGYYGHSIEVISDQLKHNGSL